MRSRGGSGLCARRICDTRHGVNAVLEFLIFGRRSFTTYKNTKALLKSIVNDEVFEIIARSFQCLPINIHSENTQHGLVFYAPSFRGLP